jgi:CRP/FNR family transcriptional regulator
MKGDVLAVDSIHTQQHTSYASALSDCDVIIVPFKALLAIQSSYPELNHLTMTIMGRELTRERTMLSMLSVLGAEAKVARFLTNLGTRFGQLGYSGKVFNLRMTRHEIASYLGLAIETVSRTLSAFHDMDLIDVDRKKISLVDLPALKTLRKLPNTRTLKSPTHQAQNNRLSEIISATTPEKMKKIVQAKGKISALWKNKKLLSAVN